MSNGKTMNFGTAIVGFVFAFVAGAGFMYAVDNSSKKEGEISAEKGGTASPMTPGAAIPSWKQDGAAPGLNVSSDDPAMGPKNAPVTLVIFSDYQCPYCSKVEPTIKAMRETYKDQIRIVWKDLPLDFHKNALPAAVAAQSVFLAKGAEAFWRFHDKAMANQSALNDENYVKWAAELGVTKADLDKFKPQAETKVKANMEAAKSVGIQGTPNFMVDGEALTGAQPPEKFKAVIDAHLKKAAELKAKGVPDDNMYAALSKEYFKAAKPAAEEAEEPEDLSVWKVDVGDAPVRGKKDALVTIVLFSDYQCPYCKRVEPSLERIEKEYGDKVRVVWKDQPLNFHKRAIPAAMFAREVRKQKGDAGFWMAHDKMFVAQKIEDADLEGYAKEIPGVDVAKVMEAIKKETWKEELQRDMDQAEDLQVHGTPHSFVNGRVVNGAVPYEKFKKVVDAELAKAEALVKKGISPDKVYEETIKMGKGGPINLEIPAYAPVKGPKDAKVVIQVFSEFQCPFCKRVEVKMPAMKAPGAPEAAGGDAGEMMDPGTGAMKHVEEKYGDKVKIVWRNFPLGFHDRAEPAAEFAMEAMKQKGADTFWKVHDDLFLSQPKLDDAALEAIAKKHGLDWAKCKDAMDKKTHAESIKKDMEDGGKAGVTGTPAFIINGKALVGAQPPEAFDRAILAALKSAK